MHPTLPLLAATDFPRIRRRQLEILQVNLGYKCNQSCLHCHVNAGPSRTEMMDGETAALVLEVLRLRQIPVLDLTGGAPELSPSFRDLVRGATYFGVRVIDRCNLTILSEPGQHGLAEFLAAHGVEVTASLPCYSPANVDHQRGDGVFELSIAGLRQLNVGRDDRRLVTPARPSPALGGERQKVRLAASPAVDRTARRAAMPCWLGSRHRSQDGRRPHGGNPSCLRLALTERT